MSLPVDSTPNRDRQGAVPSTYLITFVCYGTWLHGESGAVDRHHNLPGTPTLNADSAQLAEARERMKQQPYSLDACRRQIVLEALKEACVRRNWDLLAAHVRETHVHVVVQADEKPEYVLNALKCYASRSLNQRRLESADRRRWARHGSTRYLWDREAVVAAMHYVVTEQGEPMAVYVEGLDRSLPVAVR
jgi:REP element-mobilizing transposase RayT